MAAFTSETASKRPETCFACNSCLKAARPDFFRFCISLIATGGQAQFPFRAECVKEREQSPLRVGEKVEVIGMPPEEVCAREMYVQVSWSAGTWQYH